jgi:cell division protein FtsA
MIVSLRYEEIFKIIAGELAEAGLAELLRAGVLLCGGGAHVPGIVALAEKIFQMNVAVGHAGGISGLARSLDEPEFATAIGLVKYGALRQRQPAARLSWWVRLKELVKHLYSYIAGS